MLELGPNCERCDKNLPSDATDAMVCIFEYTFCTCCTARVLNNYDPNYRGNLTNHPIRPTSLLKQRPPATKRIIKKGS